MRQLYRQAIQKPAHVAVMHAPLRDSGSGQHAQAEGSEAAQGLDVSGNKHRRSRASGPEKEWSSLRKNAALVHGRPSAAAALFLALSFSRHDPVTQAAYHAQRCSIFNVTQTGISR